jgi:hypothetical protein
MLSTILSSMASWKTTASGVALIATAVAKFATDFSTGPVFDPGTLWSDAGMIMAGITGLVAKDANVTNAKPAAQTSPAVATTATPKA